MSGGDTARSERFKTQARSQFDSWAETYDRSILNHFLFRPSYLALFEEIARWRADHGDPFHLLDVGCGTGTLAKLLLGSDWPVSVVGLDFSPAMCAQAASKRPRSARSDRAAFLAGDAEHLPFASASFDLLTCANSFHHYPNQSAVIREFRRVLRPSGRLVLLDGFRDNAVGWFVFDVAIARVEKSVHHAPWHEIDGWFRQAALRHIRRRKFNLLFPLLITTGDA